MRLHILSDLHLEFDDRGQTRLYDPNEWKLGALFNPPKVDANILILAGDITVGTKYKSWFEEVCKRYEYILYLPGNHEYYKGDIFQDLNEEYKSWEKDIPGFIFLHNDVFELGNILFIGATLWTDFNKNDPFTKNAIRNSLNDYRLSKYRNSEGKIETLSAEHILSEHNASIIFINKIIDRYPNNKKILITHHALSYNSIHPKYKMESHLNYGFYSELDFILEKCNFAIHGHVHDIFNYRVGKCQIIANPRGYESCGEKSGYNPNLVMEV